MGLFDKIRGGGDYPRVAFLGIDGVPYSLVENNPDTFPNLHDIAESGPINSIVPPESSACWPALTTGQNPGETGVYGFQDRERDSYETYVPLGSHVKADRVWDRVQAAGREATVMNVPVTFPPQINVQRMVSGFLSPNMDDAATPDSLATYLNSIDYKIDTDVKLGHEDDKSAFIQNAHETLDARHEAFSHYFAEDDWDLFFGVFMTTDRVNHFLFGDYQNDGEYKPEFLEFYRKVDEYIGALHDQLPDDVTLVVASDHGFTAERSEVHLNAWLEEQGWLDYQTDLPESLSDISDDTRAYSLIPGRFFLNLQGREPRGTVQQSDYEEVLTELKQALNALKAPDGTPVIDRVVEGDYFHGEHDLIAPDLVAIPTKGFDLKAGFSGGKEVFQTGPRNGMHSFDNASLFIEDAEADVPAGTDLYDISPTLLDLLEIDYDPRQFEGESLV